MRPAFMLAGLVLLTLSPSAAGAPPDTAPEMASVTVALDQESQMAQPSATAPGVTQFSGRVSMDKLAVQRVPVSLESSVDTGWVSQVSPSSMVFTSTTPQAFTVTVVVPQATLSSIVGRLLVRATSSGPGADSESTANATITVAQYYRLNITCEAPTFVTDRTGVSATYKVQISNRGNGPDSFAMEIRNAEVVRSRGWRAVLDMEVTPVVQPRLYSEVTVTVTSPSGTQGFEAVRMRIDLNATSVGARARDMKISGGITLTFKQNPLDPLADVTVPAIIVAVVIALVAVGALRWRKRKARKALAARDMDEPIEVESD